MVGAAWCAQGRALAQYRSGSRSSTDCQLQSGGESVAVAVAGPQTLRLADGRFVRLAEILVPTPVAGGFDPSAAATAYLRQAAQGRKVDVKFGGVQRDRYGVYSGHLYVQGEPQVWLQEGLVRAGFAIAAPQAENHSCTPPLLAAEAAARQAKNGHWGLGYFKVLNTNDPRSIANLAGSYQIVEGAVGSASESNGRVFLHFGTTSRFGFSAAIEPAALQRLSGKQAASGWTKQTLRLRGWIDKKKGSSLPVSLSEQVEFLSEGPEPPARSTAVTR
jgi:micrococcal nuclease